MFTPANVLPLHIDTMSRYSMGMASRQVNASAAPAVTTWVADLAAFVPLSIPFPYQLRRFWWFNGSTVTTTNIDCGIYTPGGKRLVSTGSTTQVTASAIQYAAPSGGQYLLLPGMYYLAIACSNTTSRMQALAGTAIAGRSMGMMQMATALPLPATATFAVWAQAWSLPFCGITRTASGY